MYIISVSPEFGSMMYYYKMIGSDVHLCGCKLSAKRYKTFKGALHQLNILADYYGLNRDHLAIVDITELCRYE